MPVLCLSDILIIILIICIATLSLYHYGIAFIEYNYVPLLLWPMHLINMQRLIILYCNSLIVFIEPVITSYFLFVTVSIATFLHGTHRRRGE